MTAFASQWTGRVFHTTLIGLILIDIVSFATLNTQAEVFLFVLLALAAIGVALFKPEWLLPIVFAELISTSNGHGLNIELFGISVGIRMVLFAIALAATCVRVMRSRESVWPSSLRLGGILLVILFVYATVSGFLRGYDVRDVYLDANGYFAIGYIWIASVWTTTALSRHALYEACAAAVMWVAMKSLLFVFAFGHLHPVTLDPLYRWIRDTRLGEITLQVGNVYRVFLQSQWFLVPSALVTTAYILFGEQRRLRETAPRVAHLLFASSLLISLSRSFWIGLIAGIVVLALWALAKKRFRAMGKTVFDGVVLSLSAIALLWILIAVPIYQTSGSGIFAQLFERRATTTSDAALDSRRQLLGPLKEAIRTSPWFGYGLGKTVSYETQDPRYISMHGTNIVTTYAFEWGWHDVLVKFGVVGLAIFIYFFVTLLWALFTRSCRMPEKRWLIVAGVASLIALVVTHTFSPYINHPIGWGTIALVVTLLVGYPQREEPMSINVETRPQTLPHYAKPLCDTRSAHRHTDSKGGSVLI